MSGAGSAEVSTGEPGKEEEAPVPDGEQAHTVTMGEAGDSQSPVTGSLTEQPGYRTVLRVGNRLCIYHTHTHTHTHNVNIIIQAHTVHIITNLLYILAHIH